MNRSLVGAGLATIVIPKPVLGRFLSVSSNSVKPRGGVSCTAGEEREARESGEDGDDPDPLLWLREALKCLLPCCGGSSRVSLGTENLDRAM